MSSRSDNQTLIRAGGVVQKESRRLRPGQRWPTQADADEALADALADLEPGGAFPAGVEWEITEERCALWLRHGFSGRRGDTNLFRSGIDPGDNEWALFLWDLAVHLALRRGQPLHQYLAPGRRTWGWKARLLHGESIPLHDFEGDEEYDA